MPDARKIEHPFCLCRPRWLKRGSCSSCSSCHFTLVTSNLSCASNPTFERVTRSPTTWSLLTARVTQRTINALALHGLHPVHLAHRVLLVLRVLVARLVLVVRLMLFILCVLYVWCVLCKTCDYVVCACACSSSFLTYFGLAFC